MFEKVKETMYLLRYAAEPLFEPVQKKKSRQKCATD